MNGAYEPGPAIEQALARVFDPCSLAANAPLNVLEMGLIRECTVDEKGVAHIAVSATSPSCILIASIMKGVSEQVAAVDGIREVEVHLDIETFWTEELMTEGGRQKLDARRRGSMQRVPLRPRQWQENRGHASDASGSVPVPSPEFASHS